jgi:methyl-accepting chemotaxis protein
MGHFDPLTVDKHINPEISLEEKVMTWKNISLTGKFAFGFGVILLLLTVIAGWAILGVTHIVSNAEEVIEGNALRAEMIQREVDHLNWAANVNALLTDDHVTELTVETDPHKCTFGKWYYGEGRKKAEEMVPALEGVLTRIEDPHRKLHESAIAIDKSFRQANATLPKFLAEKETDHLTWANQIMAVFSENRADLDVQTDPHQCGLGKFLDGPESAEAAASDPEMDRLFKEIAQPHAQLHQSALEIRQQLKNRGQAYATFRNKTLPALTATQKIIKQLKQRADEMATGRNKANAIYASQTIPNLRQVQELIEETINTSSKHIMTDEEMITTAKSVKVGTIILSIVALPLGIFFAIIIARGIIHPLRKSCQMIEEMEKGHIDMRLNLDRGDEIGQMGRTMDAFADSLQKEMVGSLQKLAAGDLTFKVAPRDERDTVRGALKKLGSDLGSLIMEIQAAGEQIASGSMQVADASQSLSQGSTESAASLEQISASMVEMASQTKLNAENAEQANALVNQSRTSAEKGNQRMQEMVAAMAEINASSMDISKIIKVIDEIAFQTNLLALNAAVEAARAGQHGKGFAVVAEEVRNLAARSAQAAKETAELIEGSVSKVENGSQIASETELALQEIVNGVIKANGLVSEIAAASNEQSHGIGQVNQGLGQIDRVTQTNTASAEESAAAAEELSGQAEQLRRMLSRFKLSNQSDKSAQMSRATHVLTAGKNTNSSRQQTRPALPSGSSTTGSQRSLGDSGDQPDGHDPGIIIALDDGEFGKY